MTKLENYDYSGRVDPKVSAAISLKRIANALERQNELLEQANKIGERNVAAAERIELQNHIPSHGAAQI